MVELFEDHVRQFDRHQRRVCGGAGLMSDTSLDYPLGVDPMMMLGEVQAKTVCASFEEETLSNQNHC